MSFLSEFEKEYYQLNKETKNKILHTFINKEIIIKKKNNFYYIVHGNEEFLFTWKNIVNKKNIKLLEFANYIRTFYVNQLKTLIVKYFENSCNNIRNNIFFNTYCKINSIGSTALTSNYNITVSSFLVSTDIVSKFNYYFFNFWNDTSSEIFDTNLYGNCFFITLNKNLEIFNNILSLYNNLIVDNKNILYLPPKKIYIDDDIIKKLFIEQISWLIIKIYLYIDEYKIINFSNNIIYNFLNNIIQIILTQIPYNHNIINNLSLKYHNLKIEKDILKNINMPNNIYRKKLDELYVSKLYDIDKYQLQYIKLKQNNQNKKYFLLKLIEAITISNFYGNEKYFCIGTLYHVLGYIQKLGKFDMYKEYYFHSIIENLIDTMKYYEYININNNKFILKASKYLSRVYDGIIRLLNMDKNNNSNNIQKLKIKKNIFDSIHKFYKNNSTRNLSKSYIEKLYKIYNINRLDNVNLLNMDDINNLLNNILKDIIFISNFL
jgi:hypothetical protein